VRGEPLSVDEEFVALRLGAEDRVVVDDERASAFVFLEEDLGGEAADSAADCDEVVDLAGVHGIRDALLEYTVAHRVPVAQYVPGVAVRVAVGADPAVAVEGIFRRDRWGFAVEEESGAGEESALRKSRGELSPFLPKRSLRASRDVELRLAFMKTAFGR
jgi:hypothetical protein